MSQAPTVIKYSRSHIIWFIAMLLVAVGGLILLFRGGSWINYIMALTCLSVGSLLSYSETAYLQQLDKAQLIIGDDGIQTADGKLCRWSDIKRVQVKQQGSPKPVFNLLLDTINGNRVIHLNGLDHSPFKIQALIERYRAVIT